MQNYPACKQITTVNVLKFQTQVGFWRSSPIRVFSICYSNPFYLRTEREKCSKFLNIYSSVIWAGTWDFQQCGMCYQQSLRPACAYAQSDQSLCLSHEYSKSVKLLTEHHLEFLSLKRGCTGSSEFTLVKIPHCWKSHYTAHIIYRGRKLKN